MGDAQSAQRDGTNEAAAEVQSAVQDGPSGDSTHDKLIQNNGQISDKNGKPDGNITEVKDQIKDTITKEAINVTSVTKSVSEAVPNVQIIQEDLPDANKEEPIEIINVDAKQNDLNESFRKFFSNIGLKLTVKRGVADNADDKEEKEVEKLVAVEETESETRYEDVGQNTDLNAIQDNDSTTCPTMTDGTPDDVVETAEETMTEQVKVQQTNATVDGHDDKENKEMMLNESPPNLEEEEVVSPIKRFFTTGIFAGLSKKKKEDEEIVKEIDDISKNDAADKQQIEEATPNVAKQEEIKCEDKQAEEVPAMEASEEDIRAKSPSTDQDSEPEITSSQERAQSSPFKRLFSGSFKRRSKKQKRKKSKDAKLSDSVEQLENKILPSRETSDKAEVKTEQQEKAKETPPPPPPQTVEPETPSPPLPPTIEPETSPMPPLPTTEPEEEFSAWEVFKKLMTPKKTVKRASEEAEVAAATVEETKPSEEERISDQSTEEGRKRKDSSHSWEAVLCGSGRRRSRKTSDSEEEQKEDGGRVPSPNDAGDVVTCTPKPAASPSDSDSSTWKSFKKLLTPKRKIKDDEESKDNAQSDSEATQEETLFSFRRLLPGRRKKPDQLSSDEGEREAVSMEEDSETPAVVPLSEFDQSEIEETAKTDSDIEESKLESEQEHILEIPKTFVQEVQEHQVTPITVLNEDQDELTEFSKYQPLSDIPEEGNITETVATSLIEEVVKDDTIAEDMVEITSEAITAPEPVDITMADETDDLMLSAASHLPESSKTSGNATPVPAEYDVKDTDNLLMEVADTISAATKPDTVCSQEPALERAVSSVTHETLSKSVSKEQNVMDTHAQSETLTIETGFQVCQLQDTDFEIPVQAQSESLSEFKDAISTEYACEVSTAEFESAKAEIDEVHIAYPEQPVKQESVDDSEYMIESISEVPETIEMERQDMVQDVLTTKCLEGEATAMRNESTEPLFDENVHIIHKEQNVMETQAQSETSTIETGLQNDQLQDSDFEIPAQARSESLSEFTDAISMEFESAKAEADEVHIAHSEWPVKQESVDDSEYVIESLSKVPQPLEIEHQDVVQDVLTTECLEGETKAVMLDENVDITDKLRKEKTETKDLQISSEPELPNIEVKTILDICKDNDIIQEDEAKVKSKDQTDQPNEFVQPEFEEKIDVKSLKGALELGKDETQEQLQGTTEVANVETVAEKDLAIFNQLDVTEVQKPALEIHNLAVQELQVQDKELFPLSSSVLKVEIIEDIETEQPEQDSGENKQDLVAGHVSEINQEANNEAVHDTVTTAEQEGREITVEDKLMEETVSVTDEEIMQTVEDDTGEVALQHGSSKLEEQPLPDVTAGEIDDKMGVQETTKNLEQEKITEVTCVQNEGVIASPSKERRVSFKLDYTLEINGEHTEAKPAIAQVMEVDHIHEVTEDLEASSVLHVSFNNEDPSIAQELEDTIDLEKSSELYLSTSEEPFNEMHIGETEVNTEGHLEEEIPCTATELAKVECVTLPEECLATSQQVAPTMPDLMIQKTVKDSDRISEETSIPCVNNAEVLDEPKHEVRLTDVQQVGVQGEKEKEIEPPATLNADVQYAFVAQMTTCNFENKASGIPDVSLETTTQAHEPVVGTFASEQEHNQSVETTTPLEVNNVVPSDKESKPIVLLHTSSVKLEDNHEMQVQVTDVDIQSAEKRVDTTLKIVVQEDKQVLDTCHKTIEKVDSVLATSEIEQEMVSEKDKLDIQEVVQHLKELPLKSVEELEHKEPPNDLVGGKLSEDHKIMETQDEEDAVAKIQDSVKTTKDEVSTKIDEEAKDVQKVPTVGDTVPSPSDTAVAVPQNTGIISNTGNVESPSSLSLEFKLNIQFGQRTAPISPPPPPTTTESSPTESTTESNKPPKSTKVTEVGVQAGDVESKHVNEQQKSEIPDHVEETTKVVDKADNQPVLVEEGIQPMQPEDLNENNKIPEVVSPSIQAPETVLPDKEFLKKDVLPELVFLQVSKNPIKQTEDEDDNQDVWLDAEEDIYGQEEIKMPISEFEESYESQTDYFQETKSDLEESFDSIKKTTLKCDSEEEDFAAALEDPQIPTAIANME